MVKNKSVIIVAHILTTVPAEDLKEYILSKQARELFFIGHPLFYKKGRPGSFYELYKNGTLAKKKQLANKALINVVQYFRDIFLTIYWVLTTKKKWDVIIALDNLNTIAALILRKFGMVDKVIYYTIDFTPKRFNNKILNEIYHYLDKICVKNADVTWNVSPRIAEGREKIRHLDKKIYNRQITVPIGIWFDRIKRPDKNKINYHTLAYSGGISPHQGIQLVLDAIPTVIKKIPDFKFIIIGMGDYESALKKQANDLHINKYVSFLGYQEKHEDVEKIISQCGAAVAMYSKELSQWSYYADPSKIKTYLACGLPILTTSLTHIAPELTKRECGIVVEYNKDDLANAIISLMQDKKKQMKYRENAIEYAQQFDWSTVFSNGLKDVIK